MGVASGSLGHAIAALVSPLAPFERPRQNLHLLCWPRKVARGTGIVRLRRAARIQPRLGAGRLTPTKPPDDCGDASRADALRRRRSAECGAHFLGGRHRAGDCVRETFAALEMLQYAAGAHFGPEAIKPIAAILGVHNSIRSAASILVEMTYGDDDGQAKEALRPVRTNTVGRSTG